MTSKRFQLFIEFSKVANFYLYKIINNKEENWLSNCIKNSMTNKIFFQKQQQITFKIY